MSVLELLINNQIEMCSLMPLMYNADYIKNINDTSLYGMAWHIIILYRVEDGK